ncbi:uncharacterized protein LOC134468513 [Engraulis encrasicolus]|uniref:uncharacterized protein LOC134468513 n=1 Tax=Engraulis encrasicolus TaxID=184585 RepID=UPI002FD47813
MGSDLLLRAVLVFALLCCVYGYPWHSKGGSGGQPLQQQQDEGNPDFDPGFNDWVQAQMGLVTSYYSQDDSQSQSPSQSPSTGAKGPQAVSGPAPDSSLPLDDELAFFSETEIAGSSPEEPFDLSAPGMLQDVSGPEELTLVPEVDSFPIKPVYKAGTVIRRLATFEHGRDASSFFDTGDIRRASASVEPESFHQGVLPGSEHDDEFFRMFITGQLPPGTVTHFSSTFENGKSAWSDFGFEKIPPPPAPATTADQNKGSPVTKGSQDPTAQKTW